VQRHLLAGPAVDDLLDGWRGRAAHGLSVRSDEPRPRIAGASGRARPAALGPASARAAGLLRARIRARARSLLLLPLSPELCKALLERAHQVRRGRDGLGPPCGRGDLLPPLLALEDLHEMSSVLVVIATRVEVDRQLLDHGDGPIDLLARRLPRPVPEWAPPR